MPRIDVGGWFEILGKDMTALSADAEAQVHAHLATRNVPGFERWLSQGLAYVHDDTCPFCATPVPANLLIRAYHTHFDQGYRQLVAQVAALRGDIDTSLADALAERLLHATEVTRRELAGWKDDVAIADIVLEADPIRAQIAQARRSLLALAERKMQSPLTAIGAEERAAVDLALTSLAQLVEQANTTIRAVHEQIAVYRRGLEGEDTEALRRDLTRLNTGAYRHSEAGIAELATLSEARAEKHRLTEAKEAARQRLNEHMAQVFARYGTSINELLATFGAQIAVRAMAVGYRGARAIPRTEYQLEVRGQPIALAGEEGSRFGNTLSEGDKRSLAFAFFVARVLDHPRLAEQVIVVDDPMCSFDRPRRMTTQKALLRIAAQARQLIVMAHDLHFLRSFARAYSPPRNSPKAACCKIEMMAENLSTFTELDLDAELRGPYDGYLMALERYVDAPTLANREPAARSIRLAVEGSLKRAFPLDFISTGTLGALITTIRDAPDGHRLAVLKPHVPELYDINDYAKQFMHEEGDPPPDFQAIDGTELTTFSKRALDFVYR